MEQPSAAQQVYAAYSQVVEVTAAKARTARTYTSQTWAKNKPATLIGWTAFVGGCLLFLSALSTALTILAGFLLSMAWLGVVVYSVLVAVSTAGAFVAGAATLLFSGACAVMGTCILSCACTSYIAHALFLRIRAIAQGYLYAMQSSAPQGTTHLHMQLMPPSKAAAGVAATHTASAVAPADSITSSTSSQPAASQASAEPAALHLHSATGSPALDDLVHASAAADASPGPGLRTKAAALAPAAANSSYASPAKANKVVINAGQLGTAANGVAGVVGPAVAAHVHRGCTIARADGIL